MEPIRKLSVGRPVVFEVQLFYSKKDVELLDLESEWINDATVVASLHDSQGQAVIDSLPVPYLDTSHLQDDAGYYRVEAEPSEALIENDVYTWSLVITKDGKDNSFSGSIKAVADNAKDRVIN